MEGKRGVEMTARQEKAFFIIKEISDNKLYYVIRILDGIHGLQESEEDKEQKNRDNAFKTRGMRT